MLRGSALRIAVGIMVLVVLLLTDGASANTYNAFQTMPDRELREETLRELRIIR